MKELQSITVTFAAEPDAISISVTYTHPEEFITGSSRPRLAASMAKKALEAALASLQSEGAHIEWGGYRTDYIKTTDVILVETKP